MTSSLSTRVAAMRSALLLAVAIVLSSPGSVRAAQSEQSGSAKGLEGTWRVQVMPRDCATGEPRGSFPSLVAFARGGTMVETTASPAFLPGQRTPGLGVWSHVRGHTYIAITEAFLLFASPAAPPFPGLPAGTQRIEQTIDVDGDQFSVTATAQFIDINGVVQVTFCTTATGQRLQ